MSARLMRIGALVGLAALLSVTIASAQNRAEKPAGTVPEGRGLPVFNPVDGRVRVLSSRPEGARVEKGEVVCELDPAELQDRIVSQEVAVHGLRAGVQGARLAHEAAVMDLSEYKEGRFVQDLQAVEAEVTLAKTGLVRGEDNLDWTERMFQKGYASKAELVAAQLALEKAKFALESAVGKKQGLSQHTRDRTIRRLMAAVETARERELGKRAALLREEAALKRLNQQVDRCKVAAPVAGRVRYDTAIGPGAGIADGQLLFRIVPDAAAAGTAK
jgi:multidrug efflux pump subunit AcrA (membrane-fusion protein)